VEAVMTGSMVKPQQMVAQQRQLFALAQYPYRARTRRPVRSVFTSKILSESPERRRIPRFPILCIAASISRRCVAGITGEKSAG
jgi:hypothetical protein